MSVISGRLQRFSELYTLQSTVKVLLRHLAGYYLINAIYEPSADAAENLHDLSFSFLFLAPLDLYLSLLPQQKQ